MLAAKRSVKKQAQRFICGNLNIATRNLHGGGHIAAQIKNEEKRHPDRGER
jgi:hypothetical protein